MKAAYINETGPAENIIYGDLPTPEATGAQVLVKTGAVAVNPVDTYIRNGANYWDLPKPFIIGCDLAGTVEAVGPDATQFKVGDRVWGTNQGLLGRQGTFAEYCAIDECWLYPTPDNVSPAYTPSHQGCLDSQLAMREQWPLPRSEAKIMQKLFARWGADGTLQDLYAEAGEVKPLKVTLSRTISEASGAASGTTSAMGSSASG